MRRRGTIDNPSLRSAIGRLRPYRGGSSTEPVEQLYARIRREIQGSEVDLSDLDEDDGSGPGDSDGVRLAALLDQGQSVLSEFGNARWELIYDRLIVPAGAEKIVFFAQPVETVSAFSEFLRSRTGTAPAMIVGGQSDGERDAQIRMFCQASGPQFLVSSRAGGEGINLQVARRLIHLDVPWNPMELEQRVGRVHRFGGRRCVLVDTVVARDTREVRTYQVARDRLRLIASTMVEPERFEALFSRVMSLLPPEELQQVILGDGAIPMSEDDQEAIAHFVQQGFRTWQEFDRRFGAEQRRIEQLDVGLAQWSDVEEFAIDLCKGQLAEGFRSFVFRQDRDEIQSDDVPVRVVRLNGVPLAFGDSQSMPVDGPNGEVARQGGLNVDSVAAALREHALVTRDCGTAHVRWPEGRPWPPEWPSSTSLGVLAFVRTTVQPDARAGWSEVESTLHMFVVTQSGAVPVLGPQKRDLVRGLVAARVRVKAADDAPTIETISEAEISLTARLRQPSEADLATGRRHAVRSILAAIVSQ